MALALDSISAGGADRTLVARIARATRHRDSIFGRTVVDGKLVWDEP